jgi:hypothetical protein
MTRQCIATALLTLLATPILAQSLTQTEAAFLPRLIFSTCINVHDNVGCETLVLLKSETQSDTADLLILSDFRDRDGPALPLAVARNVVFNGAMWGMAPMIEPRDGGGFVLTSEQIGAGRHPWHQSLDIIWRGERFVVSEYAFSSYDRIQNHSYSCNIDLLSGQATSEVTLFDMQTEQDDITRVEAQIEPIHIDIADWATAWREPEVCRPQAEVYYNQ